MIAFLGETCAFKSASGFVLRRGYVLIVWTTELGADQNFFKR